MPSHRAVQGRKAPKQERSRATVEAILTATEQVLTEHGFDKATTNNIARRAGVSVGSLYQYFPNKEALVAALAEQHGVEVGERVMHQLEATKELPLQMTLELLIEGLLEHHARERVVHQTFIELGRDAVDPDRHREVNQGIAQAILTHLAKRPERLRPRNLELGVFMLINGVEGITHAALYDRLDALANGELKRELVDLISRYLLAD